MANMYEQLPGLIKLQEIDAELRRLRTQVKAYPAAMRKLEDQLAKPRKTLEAVDAQLSALQKEHRNKTAVVTDNEESLKKYQAQRPQVKTNKEYAALEKEIAHLEDQNTLLEDDILDLMLKMDEAKVEMEAEKTNYRKYEETYNKKHAELERGLKRLKQEIQEIEAKREAYRENGELDPALLKRYDMWTARKKTSMISVVRGNSCGTCNMVLPPQTINLLHRRNELLSCDSCNRVLYLDPHKKDESEETD